MSRGLRQAVPGACAALAAVALIAALGACERRERREQAVRLPIQVLADTGSTVSLPVPPPEAARAWLGRVTRTRPPAAARPATPPATPVRPAPLDVPAPEAPAAEPEIAREPAEALVVDDDLRPPIPIGAAPLRLPPPSGRTHVVELDVRIDEAGVVSDAVWAAGSEDPAAVGAVTACALAMRFHPALQRGKPVAVWCRQRFEFGAGVARLAPGADR